MPRHARLLAVVLVVAGCAPRANLDLGSAADAAPAFDVASEPDAEDADPDVVPPLDAPSIDAPSPPDTPSIDTPAIDTPAIDTPPDSAPACPGGDARCGADCVDTRTSPAHCGECGRACATSESCAAGVCTALPSDCRTGACPSGMYCNLGDGVCRPGCLADAECPQPGTCDPATHACRCATATHLCGTACLSNASPASCGAACSPCASQANAVATCAGGACGFTCNAGYHRCGAACVSDASPATCGGACSPCVAPANAVATCAAGACGFTCNAGWGNCDGVASNGCETNLTTSIFNCGSCNQRCGGWTGSSTTCIAGTCGFTCNANYADCDRNASNGCESLTLGDARNCGGCGTVCPTLPNSSASCSGGTCGSYCLSGYGDCDGNAANGCETALNTSASHCGRCTNACPTGPNALVACSSGACTFACSTGFASCDGNQANGCEVATTTDANNCGMCNRRCSLTSATGTCTASACAVASCNAGYGNCNSQAYDGCETDLSSEVRNCGACGNVCPGLGSANTFVTCTGGACALTCQASYSNCDGMVANGCEADLRSSAANCGACGAVCPGFGTPGTTVTCSSRVCSSTCVAGWADCNGLAADGCEVNLATSAGNCGACGTACAAGLYCVARVCGTASPAPMNESRYGFGTTVALDGRVYVFGGSNGSRLSTVERYDPATNTWVYRAGLSSALFAPSAVTLPDGRLLCIGGIGGTSTNATRAYDTATDTWSLLAPMQAIRHQAAGALGRDGKVYMFGGASSFLGSSVVSTAEVYDPVANTWTSIASLPSARMGATALTAPDGRIYVFGGATDINGDYPISTVSIYNPATNTWATGPSMPTPRDYAGGTIGADGRMYIVGGYSGTIRLNSVIALTPGATTYSTITPLSIGRSQVRAVTLQDGRILAIGGYNGEATNSVESYTAGDSFWR